MDRQTRPCYRTYAPLPLAHSRANKGKIKTPTAYSLRVSNSHNFRTTLLPLPYNFLAFVLVDASIQNLSAFLQPKCLPESQSICPKQKRAPRNNRNNKATIMRACRAVSHDFQQAITISVNRDWQTPTSGVVLGPAFLIKRD